MTYKYEDFSKCLFNPLEKKFLDKYSRLKEICDDEMMMRYVAALYDYNSPLVRDIRDLEARKREAAILAGYDLRKDEVRLEEMFNFIGDYFIKVVDKFLKDMIYSRLWYAIQAREQTIYEYSKRLLKPVSDSGSDDNEKRILDAIAVKSKLSEDMAKMEQILEQDYNKLYGNDEKLKASVKRFTPEAYATNV